MGLIVGTTSADGSEVSTGAAVGSSVGVTGGSVGIIMMGASVGSTGGSVGGGIVGDGVAGTAVVGGAEGRGVVGGGVLTSVGASVGEIGAATGELGATGACGGSEAADVGPASWVTDTAKFIPFSQSPLRLSAKNSGLCVTSASVKV